MENENYWTLLELKPMAFKGTSPDQLHKQGRTRHMVANFLNYATIGIIQKWKQILEYFDNLISEKTSFLDPNKHDNLLVDDETFSTSKKYFLAISTLKELNASLSENIHQLERLIEEKVPIPANYEESKNIEVSRSQLLKHLLDLKELGKRLSDKRQEAIDLRDGLFSASGVMESRAATRLGENGKLLTFVSIWFLPLSFCMCMGKKGNRISEILSATPGRKHKPSDWRLVQYLLRRMLQLAWGKPAFLITWAMDKLMAHVVKSMKRARGLVWKERAERFEKPWETNITDSKPSNWRLVQFALYTAFGFFAFNKLMGGKSQTQGHDATNVERHIEDGTVVVEEFADGRTGSS